MKTLRLSGHAPDAEWRDALSQLGTWYATVQTSGSLKVIATDTTPFTAAMWRGAIGEHDGKIDAVAYSYNAVIALRISGKWVALSGTNRNYSVTTSRHANKIQRSTKAVEVHSAEDLAFYDLPAGPFRDTAATMWKDGMSREQAIAVAKSLEEAE